MIGKNINSFTYFSCLIFLAIIYIQPLEAQDIHLQNRLLGNYLLDGDIKDATKQSNHGNFYGGKLQVDRFGHSNGAIELDRKSFIKIPFSFPEIKKEVSIALWVLTVEDSIQTLVSKYQVHGGVGHGFKLLIEDGKASFSGRDGSPDYRTSGQSTTMVNDSIWHFLVGICRGDAWEIWVDGKKESENNTGYKFSEISNRVNLHIGNAPHMNQNLFTGSVDEIRIYSRALNRPEIELLFKRGNISAKEEIEMRVASSLVVWEKRGKYEKTTDYVERVNPSTRLRKQEALTEAAIQKMGNSRIQWEYLTHSYDADSEKLTLTFKGFKPYIIDMPIDQAPFYDIANFHLINFENVRFGLSNEGDLEILNMDLTPPKGE